MLYRARCGQQQQVILYSPTAFADFGFRMIGAKTRGSTVAQTRRFKAHFGCEPAIASQIWRALHLSGWLKKIRPNPDHLLFALVFLRSYNKVSATLCNTNERNFLRWSWFYAEGIANLNKKSCFSHFWVRWSRLFGSTELVNFSFVDSRLRYELDISISTCHIVSYTGPFTVTDTDKTVKDDYALKKKIRACYESINSRLKQWNCLNRFRHDLNKHHICFRAVMTIEKMNIE